MKKYNHSIYLKYALFAFTCILTNACLDSNLNMPKFSPDEEAIQGDYNDIGTLFTGIQENVIQVSQNAYQFNESLTGHVYGRYMSITNDGWNGTNFGVFNALNKWLNSVFNDQFSRIYSSWFDLQKRFEDNNDSYAWAWAEIMRVAAMHRATDMYGPIPYSQIKKNNGKIQVAYDSQEVVYSGLFEDLNAAINTLTAYVNSGAANEVSSLGKFDKVYNGNFYKWVQYANSLKLRMAMRIVYVNPGLAEQYAKEAINHSIGVITSNNNNTMIAVVKNPIEVMFGPYADSRISAEVTTYLEGYADPRLEKYASVVKTGDNVGKHAGLRTGINISQKQWAIDNFSSPIVNTSDPLLWMSAAEVAFLKAEGAIWEWDMGATAEVLYNEGIKLSFEQWGASGVETYIQDEVKTQAPYTDDSTNPSSAVSTITIKWDENADFETKQERILTQKWIANFLLGHEAWAEHRRTGYPRFFTVIVNKNQDASLSTKQASRIPYAPDEYLNNNENYVQAIQLLGGSDNYSTRLWWDKKANKPNW